MRKVLVALMILLCVFSSAFCLDRIGFGVDVASVQDIFLGHGSFQVDLDLRTMVSEEFQIRIPMAFTMNQASFVFESGVALVYYPWRTGPFMSLSVFQFGFSSGTNNLENVVSLN
ncbi:MAG: hypothetical protein J5768_01375, partial [Spirochaetales bacterium]|nr:hypothetical protein [Spirochaetales bacterium]